MKKLATLTDHELVQLYEEGNDCAFDALLERYQEYVYSYVLFLTKNSDIADDIFQETFTRAIMAIRNHKYQTSGKFSAWLIRIAHNLSVDKVRESKNSKTTAQEEFSQKILNNIQFSENACETKIIEEQNLKSVKKLLDYLPEVQREVVIMRFYEDLSFKEIAQKTNVSINTSLGRMRYALINLRKIIQKHQLSLVG